MARLIAAFEQFFDSEGKPLVGGQIDFFESGSSTVRKTTFADSGETIANPNPLIINGDGRCPNVFGTGNYRAVLRFAPLAPATVGVQILSRDPIGGNASLTFGADWSADQTYSASDVVRDGGLYWVSQTNNNTGNTPLTDNGTSWLEFPGNKFPGSDPDLIDTDAAIIIGSNLPDDEQHIEIGPNDIQSKSDKTTASEIRINRAGGTVRIGNAMIGDQVVIAIAVLQSLDLNDVLKTTPRHLGGILVNNTLTGTGDERVLTESDKFDQVQADNSSTTLFATGSDAGLYRRFTAATTATLNFNDASGFSTDQHATYRAAGAGGVDFDITPAITVNGLPALVAQHTTFAFKCIGTNLFDYIGPI